MSLAELCRTTKDIAKLLDSGDDLDELHMVSESGKRAVQSIEQRQLEIKRCVQVLAKLDEKQGKMYSKCLQENKENLEALSKLEKEKFSKIQGIEKLNASLGLLENSMREIEGESHKLRQEKAAIQYQTNDILPKTKYSFSLYSNITRLRWDYGTDSDKLQGFVTSLKDVRPFSLSMNEHSPHFIANYLWDVVAAAKNSQT